MYINGPINAIRLEGQINNVKKIIYLFGDHHKSVMYQTQCKHKDSIDFHKYFYYFIINNKIKDIKYDIFFEIDDDIYEKNVNNSNNYDKKLKYIREFKKIFIHLNELKKMNNDKISSNFNYKNVDIRYYLNFDEIIKIHYLLIFYKNKNSIIDLNEFKNKILSILNHIYNTIIKIKSIFNSEDDKININKNNTLEQILYKIMYKHDNLDIKNKIKNIIFDFINHINVDYFILKYINQIKNIDLFCDDFYVEKMIIKDDDDHVFYESKYDNINDLLFKKIYFIIDKISLFFSNCMDIYVLYLLTKKNKTNIICYTGSRHMINYVRMLCKYFNFEITHADYVKYNDEIKNLKDLALFAKKINYNNFEIFETLLDKKDQCINFINFPKNFL